jgi:hypothetical protein
MYHCQVTHKPIKNRALLIPLKFALTSDNNSIFDFMECWRFSIINPIVCEMVYESDSIAYENMEYPNFHVLIERLGDRFSPYFMLIDFDWWQKFKHENKFNMYEKIDSLHAQKPLELIFYDIMRERKNAFIQGKIMDKTPSNIMQLYNFYYFATKVGISINPFNYAKNTSDFNHLLNL